MGSDGRFNHTGVYSGRAIRPGFSLIEMVVSLGVLSILMVALGSVMMVATSAGPKSASAYSATISQVHDVDRLLDELAYADSFDVMDLNEIRFTVPDRDGDSIPETIRYRWSGVQGDPLYRRENGGGAQIVFDSIRTFELEYIYDEVTEAGVPIETESSEQVLNAFTRDGFTEFRIEASSWIGMSIRPSLPPEADSWTVTRVLVALRSVGTVDGELRVQLQLPTPSGTPSGIIIDEQPLFESALIDSYTWHEFIFTEAHGLSPGDRLCLVLQHASGITAAATLYEFVAKYDEQHWMVHTTDSGANWTSRDYHRIPYYVYGTFTTVVTPMVTRTYLRRVGLKLTADETNATTVDTAVRIMNAPEVEIP